MSDHRGFHREATDEDLFRALFRHLRLSSGDDTAYEMLESLDPEAYEWSVKVLFED